MKKNRRKLYALLLAIVMILSSVASAYAASISVTYHGSIYSYDAAGGNNFENMHGKFTASSGNPVYCGEHGLPSPMGDTPGNSITLTETQFNDAQIRKILYYGYLGPEQWSGFSNSAYNGVYNTAGPTSGKTESCGIAVTSVALTRAYQRYGGNGRVYNVSGLSAFESFIAGKPDPKSSGFEAYKLPSPYGGTQDLFTWRYNPAGYIRIDKSSTESVSLSLAGARYGVYASKSNASNDTSRIATLTTNSSGNSDTATVNAGTYYVKEISAPAGFDLDTTIHSVTVTSGATKVVDSKETPSKGYLRLEKTSTESVSYSLAGAEYGVYSSSSLSTSSLVGKLTTNSSGNTNSLKLLVGTYYVKEIKAPANFELDTKTYTVNVTSGATKVVSSKEPPSKGYVNLEKTSTEPVSLSLAGAEYGVYSSSSLSSSSLVGKLTTNASGNTNSLKVNVGTYYVKEIKAPAGFDLDTTTHTVTVTDGKTSTVKSKEPPSKGYANVVKTSTEPVPYSLAGAEYGVYSSSSLSSSSLVGKLTTDASGNSNSLKLLIGKYYVKEIKAPAGFDLDTATYTINVTSGKTSTVNSKEPPSKGYAKLHKTTKNNNHLVNECPENYSLEGAKYGIYKTDSDAKADKNRLDTLTTDKNGNTNTSKALLPATYYVKELEAPKGYILDKEVHTVVVKAHETKKLEVSDEPQFDPLDIRVTKIPVEGSDKNLKVEGAEYTIKYYKQLKDSSGNKITTAAQLKNLKPYRTWVIRTDKNGRAGLDPKWLVKEKSDSFFIDDDGRPAGLHGTYSVEETLAPAGFAKTDIVWVQQASFDSKLQHIESQLEDITDNEKPQTVSITINKVDAETDKNEPQGYGSLAGAKYDVFFYDPIKADDIKVATLTTDEKGFARYEKGKPGLYKVVETKASNGYVVDREYKEVKARIKEVNTANFDYVVKSKEKPITVEIKKTSIDEQGIEVTVEGAELQLLDKDKNVIETFTSKKAAHVIKGLKVGKYYIHEVKAPEGYFPMENDIEFEVKETDKVQSVEVFNEPIPEIETDASFDGGVKNNKPSKNMEITDSFKYKKVLVGEEYIIKGQLIDKASGKAIAEATKEFTPKKSTGNIEITFNFDGSGYKDGAELVVTEKLYRVREDKSQKLVATHEDLADLAQTVNIPKLNTTATDGADGNKNLITGEEQVIKDKVFYSNLYAGKEYTVSGVLMNKATNKPILVNGKEVTASKTFTATKTSGYVELEFKLDTSALKGETIVVFENLYEKGIEVGSHADINDIEQTTYVPSLKTTATDKINDGKDLNGAEEQTIVDEVSYKSLFAGKEYTIKGVLMDKATGEPILVDGKEVKAEKKFTPTKTNGTVTLEFNLNASALKGKTIVVYERLYEDGKELAAHTEIDDVDQSMYVPKVKTSASFDGNKNAKPNEKMTVTDVFSFENLIKGQKYILKGELIDKATGETVTTAEKTFTAEKVDGNVELDFKFDGTKYAENGAELVVTEKLYSLLTEEEKLVASHIDLADLEQTVNIPKLKTTATDGADGNKNLITGEEQVIKDKVFYSKLYVGKEYTVSGVLMNKATNKPILVDGKEVTAEKTFTPKETSGFVELEFKLDTSALKGETIVVFENLYEKGIEVGSHADINDIEQTTYVPSLKTTATDKINDGKDLNGEDKQIIVDKVAYKSLFAGKEYTIKGVLMDKATGEPILVDGNEVTSETVFTPDEVDGTVTLEFSLNASALKGKTIVVYERLYEDGKELATHTEIDDVDQSMYVPKVKTSASFDGNKNCKPNEKMTVIDVFSFENLIKGQKYILKGELIDKATGETVTTAEKTFTAEKVDGNVELDFKFDGSKYAENGAELVVTEKLYSLFTEEEKLVASHIDLADLEQTVNIPKIKTTATDKVDDGKDLNGNEKQTIVDKVEYKNLYAGKEYTVKGVLMNKATNKPILVDGKEVTAEKTFTPKETSGFVELEFTFDASALKGETIVVFENLYEGKVEVAVHADINDKDQSIYVPLIKTTATSQIDGGKEALPVNTIVISDKVEYKNLIVGQMYEMNGTLVNTKTKEIIARSSGCFMAEETDGFVTLDFEFDATNLKGKDVVVFEELYKLDENGEKVKEVSEHADITDKGQTVRITLPEIGTTATSKDDGGKNVLPIKEVTIIDKVEYKDLVIGKEYTVKGILMDKETKKPLLVDGKEVTAEKIFTAEKKDGFVELEFTFNANELNGKELVVFEDLLYKDQKIATHSDINDKDQTVKVENPEVKTTATFDDGSKKQTASEKMTIVDKVEYKNLVVGKEYTVKGVLMDKATGKPFIVDGKEITSELKFTAEEKNGFVELKFKFNGTGLKKTEVVVFENLFYKDQEIASHTDIEDRGQTVKIVPPGTAIFEFDGGDTDDSIRTGDETQIFVLIAIMLSCLIGVVVLFKLKNRTNK